MADTFTRNDRVTVTLSALETARRLLRYSLNDVRFDYNQLTDTEKGLCTQHEFDVMVKQLKLR